MAEEQKQDVAVWPEADEHGLVHLGSALFDRGAVQLLMTEYTPDEISSSLSNNSDVQTWVRAMNRTHVERRGIGKLTVAGTSDRPVISGHRFTDWERRAKGLR